MIKVFIKNQDDNFLKKFNPYTGVFEFVSNLKDASIFGKVEAKEYLHNYDFNSVFGKSPIGISIVQIPKNTFGSICCGYFNGN